MNTSVQAVRLARRELRGGVRGFGVFLGCLVLGVAAIAGIGSLAASVRAGIRSEARELLGGDVAARIGYRPADPAQRAFLERSGTLSQTAALRAMARTPDGSRRSLIELKAVDPAYPLYGTLALSPAQNLVDALAERDGVRGAAVDRAILTRLRLRVGDPIKIGDADLDIRAVIERELDAAASGLLLGPRVLISQQALDQTGLIRPGALVTYEYRLRLPPGSDAAGWIKTARAAFPEAGWRLRTFAEAVPSVQRLIDRVALFLNLVGITALLVGGIGIGNAVAGFVAGKTATIATYKSLGASSRLVFTAYSLQVVGLAVAGVAAGLLIGALMPMAIAPLLRGLLPVSLRLGIYPAPLAAAALSGLLTAVAFSVWPLAAIGRIPAAALFRDIAAPARRRVPLAAALATAAAIIALAALTVGGAADRRVALWYVAGAALAFTVFRGAGGLIVWLARRTPHASRPELRLALANLHRPGAATARVVLSLGIGLTVLVAIALVQRNLAAEIDDRMAEAAPSFFFIDIQPEQLAAFEDIVRATPDARMAQVPMLRGRITRLNGVPVEDARVAAEAQWALRSDRGLTYAAEMPAGSRLAAGSWWPADYSGPPLVSFDAELAHGMGLRVGDTLTVNLLGREITARIANLREIDWGRLGINFALVFAPGILEAAPQTHLAAVYLPADREDALVEQATERLPNVSAIPVRDALAQVSRIVATIGAALRLIAVVTLAAGALVLGGAIAAGHRRRVYDAVLLKVLGATRGTIALSFVIEHGLLGIASAVIAGGLGTVAAYFLVTGPMNTQWSFMPGPLLWTILLATAMTLALGFAGTWRALGARPAPVLRNE
ncbi:MAG: ABC transporter permease [Alphaproteobacteria bacterium]|nr:ABC transporter permease [Alphaproteobacteria bacterium]